MLAEEIKKRMFAAMKEGDTVAKEILRVARGEIDRVQSTSGTPLDDAQVEKLVRKLIKSNQETLQHVTNPAQHDTLMREIEVLQTLLPAGPTPANVIEHLQPVLQAIRDAKNDGQATGLAVKHLTANGVRLEGSVVAAAVKQLRQN